LTRFVADVALTQFEKLGEFGPAAQNARAGRTCAAAARIEGRKAMRKLMLLGLAVSAPLAAQTREARSPEAAAEAAVQQCIEHVRAIAKIDQAYSNQLVNKGFVYQRDAPDFLAETKTSRFGVAQYAQSPSTEGEIWAIGYDRGPCMVVTMVAGIEAVQKGYAAVFDNGKWHKEKPRSTDKDAHIDRFRWEPDRLDRILAEVVYRDDDAITTVTFGRERR
jgi:hypothetical protein